MSRQSCLACLDEYLPIRGVISLMPFFSEAVVARIQCIASNCTKLCWAPDKGMATNTTTGTRRIRQYFKSARERGESGVKLQVLSPTLRSSFNKFICADLRRNTDELHGRCFKKYAILSAFRPRPGRYQVVAEDCHGQDGYHPTWQTDSS